MHFTRDVIHFGTGLITNTTRGQVHDFAIFVHLTGACILKSTVIQELIRDVRRVDFCLNLIFGLSDLLVDRRY